MAAAVVVEKETIETASVTPVGTTRGRRPKAAIQTPAATVAPEEPVASAPASKPRVGRRGRVADVSAEAVVESTALQISVDAEVSTPGKAARGRRRGQPAEAVATPKILEVVEPTVENEPPKAKRGRRAAVVQTEDKMTGTTPSPSKNLETTESVVKETGKVPAAKRGRKAVPNTSVSTPAEVYF